MEERALVGEEVAPEASPVGGEIDVVGLEDVVLLPAAEGVVDDEGDAT